MEEWPVRTNRNIFLLWENGKLILTKRKETPPETKPNQPTTQNPTNPRNEQSLRNTCSKTLAAMSCLKSLGTLRRCLVWTDSACMRKACVRFLVASVNNHSADIQTRGKPQKRAKLFDYCS